MYTRKWANNPLLKGIPIFSVDYRKSPKSAYPDGKKNPIK
jgi:hypothetical protein